MRLRTYHYCARVDQPGRLPSWIEGTMDVRGGEVVAQLRSGLGKQFRAQGGCLRRIADSQVILASMTLLDDREIPDPDLDDDSSTADEAAS